MSNLFINAITGINQGIKEFEAKKEADEEKQYERELIERKLAMEQARLDDSLATSRQARSIKDLTLSEMQKDISLKDKQRAMEDLTLTEQKERMESSKPIRDEIFNYELEQKRPWFNRLSQETKDSIFNFDQVKREWIENKMMVEEFGAAKSGRQLTAGRGGQGGGSQSSYFNMTKDYFTKVDSLLGTFADLSAAGIINMNDPDTKAKFEESLKGVTQAARDMNTSRTLEAQQAAGAARGALESTIEAMRARGEELKKKTDFVTPKVQPDVPIVDTSLQVEVLPQEPTADDTPPEGWPSKESEGDMTPSYTDRYGKGRQLTESDRRMYLNLGDAGGNKEIEQTHMDELMDIIVEEAQGESPRRVSKTSPRAVKIRDEALSKLGRLPKESEVREIVRDILRK